MILSLQEKTRLLERLPSIELSYDTIVHKKVHANVFVVIPKGKKALVWFTYWKGQNVCFVLTLNERGNICNVENYPVCFHSDLSLSTLLYGTLFDVNHFTCQNFTCENVYYYKGFSTGHYNYRNKLGIFKELFTYFIKQVAYTTSFLIIGLPVMKMDFQEAINAANDLPYHTYGIQMYYLHKPNTSEGIYVIKQSTQHEAYFNVKAMPNNDIYNLYCYNQDAKEYGVAMIPSYKSSVMMNSLFRTIKENANLDLLEESDDEEEFQNNNENKFVDLNKCYSMKCVYLKRFRKWQPIEVFKEKDNKQRVKIITFKEAQMLEK
jgi:hypothetical protein